LGGGRVQLTWHLVAGGIAGPTFHRLGRAGTDHSPTWRWRGFTVYVQGNFKIKFQTYIFEIILKDKDNFLRLMFAYTTSYVYLTLMFKFEIYSTNFREIAYPWPYINSVVMTIFVKLVLIHGLIQIVLMMTNYDLYYCMI
jgi:hypothetical protein